jgi:hypothetical protein
VGVPIFHQDEDVRGIQLAFLGPGFDAPQNLFQYLLAIDLTYHIIASAHASAWPGRRVD